MTETQKPVEGRGGERRALIFQEKKRLPLKLVGGIKKGK